jgi:hypothetical protein
MSFTVSTDVQALLGIGDAIPTALLRQADVWVRTKMSADGIGIPDDATDDMKLAGAYICAAMFVESKASNKSWNQSVSIGGASFSNSDAAKQFRGNAKDLISAMSDGLSDFVFEAVTYQYNPSEYYP